MIGNLVMKEPRSRNSGCVNPTFSAAVKDGFTVANASLEEYFVPLKPTVNCVPVASVWV